MPAEHQVKTLHFAELLLHTPHAVVKCVQLEDGETQPQAQKRFARVHGSALTAIAFYDRAQIVIAGLKFTSEVINRQKPITIT